MWGRALARRREGIDLTSGLGAAGPSGEFYGEALGEFQAEVVGELGGSRFEVVLRRSGLAFSGMEVIALCEEIGETPLPPYIRRSPADPRRQADRERYQTVIARAPVAPAGA